MKKIFKLFQEKNSNVVGIEYSSELQKNYFQFVESQYKKGLRQVIVTSKLMLKIIEEYFLNQNYRIIDINLGEEDFEMKDEIDNILKRIEKDRGKFFYLLKRLEFISNNSSIDIEYINLSSNSPKNGKYITFTIKVNGIVIIEDDLEEIEIKKILELVEKVI